MGSKDPILELLKEYSYTAVRLPRTGIEPLQVLQKQGNDLIILGELRELMEPNSTPYPTISADKQAGFINGKSSRELKLAVGVSMLGNLIGAMTGTKLKLNPAFGPARSMSYQFDDVMMKDVNQIELSKYLGTSRLAAGLDSIKLLVEAGELFVITSVIKSKKFTATAQDANGASVPIDVEVLKGMAGGSVNFKVERADESRVTFEGPDQLVFGIQAAQIEYTDGRITGLKQIKATGSAVRGLPDVGSTKPAYAMLETDAPFIKLGSRGIERKGKARGATTSMAQTRGAVLKKGSSGLDVRRWQAFLISKGYLAGKPGGVFDDATHNATIEFQKVHGLGADGVVGAGTLGEAPEVGGNLASAATSVAAALGDVTESLLKQVMPAISPANSSGFLPYLKQAMAEFEINTPARAAAFLAQLAHESGQFRYMAENLGTNSKSKTV